MHRVVLCGTAVLLACALVGCRPLSNAKVRVMHLYHTGMPLGTTDCLRRPPELDDVVLVAHFWSDYGCTLRGVVVGAQWFDDATRAGRAVLREWAWSKCSFNWSVLEADSGRTSSVHTER